ncbi:MAG: aldehyde dehydrogenase family protein [Woeseiaceae bacterium]|nr:aldehyde dehydrogenase family protein [Woeseiaceae bacterium]
MTPNASAGLLEVTSPYDGNVLQSIELQGEDHVEEALSTAYKLFRNRDGWLSIPGRVAILERTAQLMVEQQEALAKLAAGEGGKPLQDSMVEVVRAIDGVRLCIETLRGHAGEVIPVATTPATAGRIAYTRKEPVGVVVAVSAFNHPLNLIVHQVAPAVATGCPVIVKPAEDTPLSCLRFVELLHEAGLPGGWCQAFVADSNETAELLVTDSRVAFFSFIGSAKVGWMLRSKLAPGTRCALEHGGAAPVVLLDDLDEDAAVASILKGGFYHAGQVCVSVQRVFAPAKIARSFAKALAREAEQLVVGDPLDPNTEVGPLIRPGEVDRVAEWVDAAVEDGAKLMCGGQRLDNNCYAPTVLLDPPPGARVSTLEIFGPVVCVYSYDDIGKALEQANSLPTAFQAAVYGKDIDRIMHVVASIDASAVMVNDHSAFRDDVMPFAGLRESGLGVGGIPYTMHDMQIDKMTVIKTAPPQQ